MTLAWRRPAGALVPMSRNVDSDGERPSEHKVRPSPDRFPAGRTVHLPGGGATFVRQAPGPPGSPTVVLLHGWTCTADITWHGLFEPLAQVYSVVAPDFRGHGRGPRGRVFTDIELVTRDVAALIETLDVGPVIVTGYSLGAAVGQTLARARPDLVSGLVLCASSCCLAARTTAHLRRWALRLAALMAALLPEKVSAAMATRAMKALYDDNDLQRWILSISRHHRWSSVLSLGAAAEAFDSRDWVAEIDVPSAVIVTARDKFIPAVQQWHLAKALHAEVVVIDGDHNVCLSRPDRFADCVLEACRQVFRQADDASEPATA